MDDRKGSVSRRRGNGVAIGIAGWLAGMLTISLLRNSYLYIVPIAGAVGIFLWPHRQKAYTRYKVLCTVFFLFATCAMLRFSFTENNLLQKTASLPFMQKVTIEGMVMAPSEAGDHGSQFVLKGSLIKGKEKLKKEIRFIVRETEGQNYMYGDIVRVNGVLEKPEPFETTTGGMFDYPNYLKKDGILAILKATSVATIATKKGNPVLYKLILFEDKLENAIKDLIPGMQGSLASGVLLGDKQITKENREAFIATGTTHIIALSGYNVSIVANFFRELFSFLPLAGALAMGGLAIVLFVVMTGLQSSAVRAGIMGCIVLFAKAKGREANIGTVLLMAGFVMTAINPYTLYYDVSAQLSFLATVGVIYFSPTVAHWFTWLPEKKFGLPWREIATGTIGTQMFVLPFILYKTGVLSIISPLTNITVLPFMPYLMAFAAIVALLGVVYAPIALPFASIGSLIAGTILSIISLSTKVPFAAVPLATPLWAMALMYIFLIYRFDPFAFRAKEKTETIQ